MPVSKDNPTSPTPGTEAEQENTKPPADDNLADKEADLAEEKVTDEVDDDEAMDTAGLY